MRLYISLAVAVLVVVLLLTACNSNELARRQPSNSQPPAPSSNRPPLALPPAQIPSGEEARRITPAELKDKLASGQAILIDVRGEAAYNASHIKGSLQIPYAEMAARSDELPRNKLIVTYCS
jgi:hypothetical protein